MCLHNLGKKKNIAGQHMSARSGPSTYLPYPEANYDGGSIIKGAGGINIFIYFLGSRFFGSLHAFESLLIMGRSPCSMITLMF